MSSTTPPLLIVEDLTVEVPTDHGERRVGLRRVSLELAAGEMLALAGEAGSGKSLLARLVAGVAGPQVRILGGHIRYAGRELFLKGKRAVRDFLELRRGEITVIPLDATAPFDPTRTVKDWLADLRRLAGERRGPAKELPEDVFFAAGLLEPGTLLRERFGDLAPLTRKRLLVMRAIFLGSRLLVSEEAGADLDRVDENLYHDLLARVRDEYGLAVLLTTGRLRGFERVADRIGIFFEGGLLEMGPAAELLSDPRHRYTREFLACEPGLADLPHELPGISRAALREAEASVHQAAPSLEDPPTG